MTDKQIITIDGVDIKDCKRRIGKDNYCRYYKRPCAENNYNCIWKKYLRKEQELQEAMDNYVQLDLQRVKEYNELVDLYKAKEQECKELKAEIKLSKEMLIQNTSETNKYTIPQIIEQFISDNYIDQQNEDGYTIPVFIQIENILDIKEDLEQQLDQLKEENDKLKKQVCGLRPELKFIIDKTCCKYNIEAKYYHEKIVEIINNLDKMKTALAEIKEIAEKRNYLDCNGYLDDILQKISECEENNDMENN